MASLMKEYLKEKEQYAINLAKPLLEYSDLGKDLQEGIRCLMEAIIKASMKESCHMERDSLNGMMGSSTLVSGGSGYKMVKELNLEKAKR
jgi:hypothetical protein